MSPPLHPVAALHPLGGATAQLSAPNRNTMSNAGRNMSLKALAREALARNTLSNAHGNGGEKGATKPATPPCNEVEVDPERAAIIEVDAKAPRLWAEAYASLCWTRQLPEGVSPAEWVRIRDRVGRFIDRWSARAERLGWRPAEVVSVDWSSEAFRAFAAGDVVSVTGEALVFEIDGGRRSFGRDGRQIGGAHG